MTSTIQQNQASIGLSASAASIQAESLHPNLEKLQAIALANGGRLLSTVWIGSVRAYRFAFADGREFEMTYAQMTSKRVSEGWPKKPDQYLATPESRFLWLKGLAEANGAKLLETRWLGAVVKHRLILSNGAEYSVRPNSLRRFGWPDLREVMSDDARLDELRQLALRNGGILVSERWLGAKAKHHFRTASGKDFSRTPDNIQTAIKKGRSGWPEEGGQILKKEADHLQELKDKAIARGGRLVSDAWVGNDANYLFQDSNGNLFEATAHNVKAGSWSPHEGRVSEPLCRQIMEHLFGDRFPLSRIKEKLAPDALGTWFELDGFCELRKIAFEYQGHPSHWNPENQTYATISNRDRLKQEWCDREGVVLVVIPPIMEGALVFGVENTMAHVLKAIQSAFLRLARTTPNTNSSSSFQVDHLAFRAGVEFMDKLRTLAAANGGELLDQQWRGAGHKYSFLNEKGEKFSRKGSVILCSGWPKPQARIIEGYATRCLEEMQAIATNHGGRLISTQFGGVLAKHEFAFPDGRSFFISLNQLRNKRTGGWPKADGRFMKGPYGPDAVALARARQRCAAESAAETASPSIG
jgi:hypothetical protein